MIPGTAAPATQAATTRNTLPHRQPLHVVSSWENTASHVHSRCCQPWGGACNTGGRPCTCIMGASHVSWGGGGACITGGRPCTCIMGASHVATYSAYLVEAVHVPYFTVAGSEDTYISCEGHATYTSYFSKLSKLRHTVHTYVYMYMYFVLHVLCGL